MMQNLVPKNLFAAAILFFCTLGAGDLHGQFAGLIKKQFTDFTEKRLGEKIYVHTDKQFFLAGEIIWLKLYVVDASSHKPLAMSKLAYVDILDNHNRPIAEAKIELNDAEGKGSIYLPVQVASGNYKLRAYTGWMKNYPADFFFKKSITIVNTQKPGEWPDTLYHQPYDLQFFPEGGHLVTGINSKVGFRMTGKDGRGLLFHGALVNQDNDTVAAFQPQHAGIGSFIFKPLANQQYTAVIRLADGRLIRKAFVSSEEKGYVLSVKDVEKDSMHVTVQTNLSEVREVYLLAHTRQEIKLILPLNLTNGQAGTKLPLQMPGDGITHLTLFSAAGNPLAERLVFRFPKHHLNINITPDLESFKTRSGVAVKIFTSVADVSTGAHLSMSVYRVDSLQHLPDTDILSYLLLASDLKGHIESPSWYFNLPIDEAAPAIDNLMLTHGWRRFAWKDVQAATSSNLPFPPEYNGHLVTAKITDSAKAEPAGNVEAFLSVPGSHIFFSSATSNHEGIARFEMNGVYGPSELILRQGNHNKNALRLEVESPFSGNYDSDTLTPFNVPSSSPKTLLDHYIALQVRNAYNGQQLKQLTAIEPDSMSFYGKSSWTYMLDDYTRFRTMEEVLREYVKLVFVRRKDNGFYLRVYDPDFKKTLENDPLILIDGVPVFDYEKLMALDPLQIRKLEVTNNRYFFGNSIFDGILHWMSYDRNLAGYELEPNVTVMNYEGLQLQREFFSPVYDTDDKINSPLPDFRNLLYWQPDIRVTAEQGRELSFYTSDMPGRYAIVIEGLTAEGICGSVIKFFEVKERL